MVAGRPRYTTPSHDECVELGESLVKWATEETTEWRCLFSQWWCIKEKMLRKEWKALQQIPEFRPYYEQAAAALLVRSIDGTMEKTFGHRYMKFYDREQCEFENEQADIEANRKKNALSGMSDFVVKVVDYATHKNQDPESNQCNP